MDGNNQYGLTAAFDLGGSWGELLTNVAWLRWHSFRTVILVAQEHEEGLRTGARAAQEGFPRVLGTCEHWRRLGWRVRENAEGYDGAGKIRPRLYSLDEVYPGDGVEPAAARMFDPVEPSELVGSQMLLRQRVWNDLADQLERRGFALSYTFSADQPATVIDVPERSARIPAGLPVTKRIGDVARAVAIAVLAPVYESASAQGRPRGALDVITSSAAHIVMTATGLDATEVSRPTERLITTTEPETVTRLVLTIGEVARHTANIVLAYFTAPLRHHGTATRPEPSRRTRALNEIPFADPAPRPSAPRKDPELGL